MYPFAVIIATHNRPDLLRRAITSVKDQTQGIAQLIVVSDSHCKETYEVAAPLLGKDDHFVQRSGTPGPAESRNLGIRLSRGRFVVFLDDDDALSSDYLETALGHVSADTVIYTDFANVFERREQGIGQILSCQDQSLGSFDISGIYCKNFIPLSCLVYPREAVIGRDFDATIDYEDWDFLLNVATDFSLRHVAVNGPIIYNREHADNRGRANEGRLEQTYRRVYQKWPAPTQEQKLARHNLLQSAGLAASLDDL